VLSKRNERHFERRKKTYHTAKANSTVPATARAARAARKARTARATEKSSEERM
jgi:hypothetical protein